MKHTAALHPDKSSKHCIDAQEDSLTEDNACENVGFSASEVIADTIFEMFRQIVFYIRGNFDFADTLDCCH